MSEGRYWTRGRIVIIAAGCLAMVAGYALVPQIDDLATNAAAVLSPLFIVGGLLAVLAGFLITPKGHRS